MHTLCKCLTERERDRYKDREEERERLDGLTEGKGEKAKCVEDY